MHCCACTWAVCSTVLVSAKGLPVCCACVAPAMRCQCGSSQLPCSQSTPRDSGNPKNACDCLCTVSALLVCLRHSLWAGPLEATHWSWARLSLYVHYSLYSGRPTPVALLCVPFVCFAVLFLALKGATALCCCKCATYFELCVSQLAGLPARCCASSHGVA